MPANRVPRVRRNENQASGSIFDEGAMSVVEFGHFIGVKRAKAFNIVANGEIEFVRVGADRKIPRRAAVAYLERLYATQRSGCNA